MKKVMPLIAGLLIGATVQAEQLIGVNRFVCAASQVQICIESDSCYLASAWELSVPDFVVIDLKKKNISTTKASGLNRSTQFSSVRKDEGLVYLQGVEGGRAFSFVIDEESGRMTVAVSRDGLAVNVFGICTGTDL